MKFTKTKLVLILAILGLSHSLRLVRRRRFRSNETEEQRKAREETEKKRNIIFVNMVKKTIAPYGLETDKLLGKGSFGTVFSLKNNESLVIKAIDFKEHPDEKELTDIEIDAMCKTKGFKFSLPICYDKLLISEKKPFGALFVLPKAKSDLLKVITDYHDKETKGNETKTKEQLSTEFKPKLEIILQLALSLAEIQNLKFVHRDIKPDNYLVMEDGRIVLADFGLVDDRLGKYVEGFIGTDGYIPGDSEEKSYYLTKKVDSYAIGIVIFELLVPEFFNCMKKKGKCIYDEFEDKIKKFNRDFLEELKQFKAKLDGKIRNISKKQEQIEELLFKRVFVKRNDRLMGNQLVEEVKKIAGEALFKEIEEKYPEAVKCAELKPAGNKSSAIRMTRSCKD